MPNEFSVPSLFQTLLPDPQSDEPLIGEGDCGVILRADGRVNVFSTGVSPHLQDDPSQWGEKERGQFETGKKLMAISVALQNDQLMSVLYEVAQGVLDAEQVVDAIRH